MIKPVNPKGNQPWIFIGRADAETEAPILWPPDVKSWLIRKDPDVGKNWGQEEKGTTTEDEMVAWHHQLNGHEFEKAPGDSEGQGSLVCCSPWGRRARHDRVAEQQQDSIISQPAEERHVGPSRVIPASCLKETLSEDHQASTFPGEQLITNCQGMFC